MVPVSSHLISSHKVIELNSGWQFVGLAEGSVMVETLAGRDLPWQQAVVPGTVAQGIKLTLDDTGRFDDQDWCYRLTFEANEFTSDEIRRSRLRFYGLATLADVWLNQEKILSADNMFREYVVDVTKLLQPHNTMIIHFKSLTCALKFKKPRPRWKTSLVNHQNLRWYRTTLLGRIAAWSPPIEAVGPWRPIALETIDAVDVLSIRLPTRVVGTSGIVDAHIVLSAPVEMVTGATLCIDGESYQLLLHEVDGSVNLFAEVVIPDVRLWWPNTHGDQHLLRCQLNIQLREKTISVDCGNLGFKTIRVNFDQGLVQFQVNGQPVFCRGACWTVNDYISLVGSDKQLRTILQLARDANVNMIRVGGTMVYERERFFQLCDEFGIMVWQDFMFANMDYPVEDPAFLANILEEAQQQLNKLHLHVCVAAYCAGSEIEQQAAMVGLAASDWGNEFFTETLPSLCSALHPDIPYFRGSPSGGDLPFHVSEGIAHYYGVGAYRRPISDVKHAGVKFASECLGFSNVPEPGAMMETQSGRMLVPHHPRWKERVARDSGSGYDFEDVRDFYLWEMFRQDAVALRSEDCERYYALSRCVSGEVMLRTFAEWRRQSNVCGGGLVWFYKDLWPGAGWGVVDSQNRPKAAWYYLKRAWAPQAAFILDDGLDGAKLLIINDSSRPLFCRLEFGMLQHGRFNVLRQSCEQTLAPREQKELSVDSLVGHFTDCNYAYRFGPPSADTLYCRLVDLVSDSVLAEDVVLPLKKPAVLQDASSLQASATLQKDGTVIVRLSADVFLQDVSFVCDDYSVDKRHLHVLPGREYTITFTPLAVASKFKAYLTALNLWDPLVLRAG